MAEKEVRIKLDDRFVLCHDEHCYWVARIDKCKNGKDRLVRVSGYSSTFEDAVDSCIEHRIRESEVETLKEMAKEIWKIKKDVRSWKILLEKEQKS